MAEMANTNGEREYMTEIHRWNDLKYILRTSYCGPQTIESSFGPGGVDQ